MRRNVAGWFIIILLLAGGADAATRTMTMHTRTKTGTSTLGRAFTVSEFGLIDDNWLALFEGRMSYGAAQVLLASQQIVCDADAIIPVSGNAGAVTLTSNPQISTTGVAAGKTCLLQGGHATNKLTIVDGNGVSLPSGNVTLNANDLLLLVFDGTQWSGLPALPSIPGNIPACPADPPVSLDPAVCCQVFATQTLWCGDAGGTPQTVGGSGSGASTLDQAFDGNRRIDGAVSLGSAVQLGGTTRAWHLYQDGTGALRVRACDTAGANCVTVGVQAESGSDWTWTNENGTACYTIDSVTGVLTESTAGTCTPNILSGGGSGDVTAVGTCTTGSCATEGGNDMFPFIYEGTADAFETTFQVTDPTADRTITFPDAGGEVSLLGQSISGSELDSALDLGGNASLEVPNSAAPTTDAFGEIAGDNNAWATGRGAIQWYDGTANTYIVGALASDTPTNGDVPTWNTGGTITWERPGLLTHRFQCQDRTDGNQNMFMATAGGTCGTSETGATSNTQIAGRAGTLTGIACTVRNSPGSGTTWTWTVRTDHSTDSNISCAITNPGTTCTGTGSVAVTANTRVTMKFVESGTAENSANGDVYCAATGTSP